MASMCGVLCGVLHVSWRGHECPCPCFLSALPCFLHVPLGVLPLVFLWPCDACSCPSGPVFRPASPCPPLPHLKCLCCRGMQREQAVSMHYLQTRLSLGAWVGLCCESCDRGIVPQVWNQVERMDQVHVTCTRSVSTMFRAASRCLTCEPVTQHPRKRIQCRCCHCDQGEDRLRVHGATGNAM